jgi:hypothetical protein
MTSKPIPQLEFSLEGSAPTKEKGLPKASGYLLNPAKVREFALALASSERHHEFNAVSVEFIQRIDARLRNLIHDEIKRHPSRGKRLT